MSHTAHNNEFAGIVVQWAFLLFLLIYVGPLLLNSAVGAFNTLRRDAADLNADYDPFTAADYNLAQLLRRR